MSQLSGEWIRAQGEPSALMDFANSRLAEPFEEQASSTKPDFIAGKKTDAPAGVIPAWALGTFLTADVQKHILYYVVRSWGAGGRSQLVSAGQAATFAELEQIAFGGRLASHTGEAKAADCVAIDARYREDEVMGWASRFGGRVIPIKGSATQKMPFVESQVKGYPGVVQRSISPNHFKDFLHGLIHAEDGTLWTVHRDITPDYCKQMSSEHKVHDPKSASYVWQVISKGADNHWWDCEVYQVVLAQLYNIFQMTDAMPATQPDIQQEDTGGGWVNAHRGRW